MKNSNFKIVFKLIINNHPLNKKKMLAKLARQFRMFSTETKGVPPVFTRLELDMLFKPDLKQVIDKQHKQKQTEAVEQFMQSFTITHSTQKRRQTLDDVVYD